MAGLSCVGGGKYVKVSENIYVYLSTDQSPIGKVSTEEVVRKNSPRLVQNSQTLLLRW